MNYSIRNPETAEYFYWNGFRRRWIELYPPRLPEFRARGYCICKLKRKTGGV